MLLTVGVISRNGLPHLHRCLESLLALSQGVARTVEFVLVDSASTDGTLDAMLSFAHNRRDTKVYSMRGRVNAAAARNVIIRNASPGALFLVDGDVSINLEFVARALSELEQDTCDVVYGQLPEILHDSCHRPIGRNADLYRVRDRRYVKLMYGIALLGPNIRQANLFYDECQRRSHDFELGLRIADRFRILTIPVIMGTHYTVRYFSPYRVREFYRDAYMRPLGRILRKQMFSPWRIWPLRRPLSGHVLGFLLQVLFASSILFNLPLLSLAVTAAIGIDVGRFVFQRRLNEYVPVRLVAPWQIALGFVWPESDAPSYVVEQCYPHPSARGTATSPSVPPLGTHGSEKQIADSADV